MVKIFGNCGAERITIKEGNPATGGTQPATQFSSQGCLATAG
jgi:hypothetical protein